MKEMATYWNFYKYIWKVAAPLYIFFLQNCSVFKLLSLI